jgi:hypothetical protein
LNSKNVEDQERRTIVDDAIKKITSGNLAAKALTEAFESAEDDRRKVEQVIIRRIFSIRVSKHSFPNE